MSEMHLDKRPKPGTRREAVPPVNAEKFGLGGPIASCSTTTGRLLRWFGAYRDLLFIRWANIRNEWYFHVLLGLTFPIAILVFMKLTGAADDPGAGLYVATGNAVMSLVMGPMQSLCNDFAWARQRNDLEYFASLPVSKLQITLAFASVSAIFVIPTMILSIFIGSLWFGFAIRWHIMVVPVMAVSALSTAGLGVLAGVNARSGHQANLFNSAVTLVVAFLSPVLIPYQNLPLFLQWTSKALPTSYAAAALRGILTGSPTSTVWVDLGIVSVFTVIFLYLATKRLDWRTE